MKSAQTLLPVFGLVAAVQAQVTFNNNILNNATNFSNNTINVNVIEVVDSFTTYCNQDTTLITNGVAYTATKGQILTVTDCPCTITKTTKSSVLPPPTPIIPVPVPILTIGPVVTAVVTAYTTYCPYATTIIEGEQTYTVSEATTLTVTNCPCTVTYPATSTSYSTLSVITTYCPTPTVIPVTIGTSTSICTVATAGTATIPVVYTTQVAGSPPTPCPPSGVASGTASPPKPYTTGPLQITSGAGMKVGSSLGGLAAIGLAMLL